MEYYYSLQSWLYQTNLYQGILKEMPAPLNNIHFDTVMFVVLVVYVVWRIVEIIRMFRYHKRIRKKQANERQSRRDREQEMLDREKQVEQNEERLNRFLDYMEFLFARRMRRSGFPEQYSTVCAGKRIGLKNILLEKKDALAVEVVEVSTSSKKSDYDEIMKRFAYDDQQEKEFSRMREEESAEAISKLRMLDEELRMKDESDHIVEGIVTESDPDIEKRKARARKKEEKERKRAEKLLKKKERGTRHGRFGKQN